MAGSKFGLFSPITPVLKNAQTSYQRTFSISTEGFILDKNTLSQFLRAKFGAGSNGV
jgi:hypothetical protein